MSRSITTRLIALLSLCALLIVGTGMAVDYRLSRQEILERLQRESRQAVRATVIDMENWLDGVEGATRLLAAILGQRQYTHAGLEQMLQDVLATSDDIFGAAIALAPGQTDSAAGFAPYYFRRNGQLVYADLARSGHNYQQQAWFTAPVAAGAALWTEPYFDAGGGEVPMTTFAVPVYRRHSDGERFLYAVVTADVTLEALHAYLQHLRLGNNGFGILLSREGTVLSARNPANIMRHYSAAVATAQDKRTWHGMFEAALEGEVVTRRLPCDGLPGQCVFQLGALETTGWPVGVVYSEDELLQPLREFQLKTGLIALLTLLLTALAVALVTRRLTRPLTALAAASDSVARGELEAPLPRPRGEDEVATLVRSFATMQANLKTYIADLETATARRSRLEGELGAAREIQMAMLPGQGEVFEQTGAYSLWARVRPARSVGGDLYGFRRRGDCLFLAVGDVSDKGVPAALFMARAMALIQQQASMAGDPAEAMASLNNTLQQGNENCMFLTLFLGVLDLRSGELRFASAGHTAPSLLRGGAIASVDQRQGPALGLVPDLHYESSALTLRGGDRLAIFTDGVDEAFNDRDETFGMERFNATLLASGERALPEAGNELLDAIDRFAGRRPQSDDITLMLLELPPTAEDDDRTPGRLSQTFTLEAGLVGRVQGWLQSLLAPLAAETRQDLLLVAEEVVSNIAKYAGLATTDSIDLHVSIAPERVEIQVCDPGEAFDPLTSAGRAELGEDTGSAPVGGLGVHLITALTDRQRYHREGGYNILTVTKLL